MMKKYLLLILVSLLLVTITLSAESEKKFEDVEGVRPRINELQSLTVPPESGADKYSYDEILTYSADSKATKNALLYRAIAFKTLAELKRIYIDITFGEIQSIVPQPIVPPQMPEQNVEVLDDNLRVDITYLSSKFTKLRKLDDISLVVLHHTGSETYTGAMRELEQRELAAHFVLAKDGTLYRILKDDIVGAHATGYNTNSIGIEIVNTGKKDDEYTEEQYASLNLLLKYYEKKLKNFKIDDRHVLAQYETSKKLCDANRNTAQSQCGKWDPSPNFDWSKIGLPDHTRLELAAIDPQFGYQKT